jgi:hypothetical protein
MKRQCNHYPKIDEIPESAWEELYKKRIYFGHKSVGNNILDGVRTVMADYPQTHLKIIDVDDIPHNGYGCLAHSKIGTNGDPISKIHAFSGVIEKLSTGGVQVAFFKFCYVDITATSNIDGIFSEYRQAMSTLKTKFPDIIFIHLTVPLTVLNRRLKTLIKLLLRKDKIWEYDNLVAKNAYNSLIRDEYLGKEPIFDIAEIESTRQNGQISTFKRLGETYCSLVPSYSNDGGHLNDMGKQWVAKHLMVYLATLEPSITLK